MAKRALLALAWALATGCTPLPAELSAPSVQIMRIEPLPGHRDQVTVELRFQNLNQTALEIEGYRFALALDEQRFALGVGQLYTRMPQFSEMVTEMVVRTDRLEVVRQLDTPGASAGWAYKISGNFFLADGRRLGFRGAGRLLGSGLSY